MRRGTMEGSGGEESNLESSVGEDWGLIQREQKESFLPLDDRTSVLKEYGKRYSTMIGREATEDEVWKEAEGES